MRKLLALAAGAFLIAGPASAAIVNLHGVHNASGDGSGAVSLSLAAGTYEVKFVQDEFTAFSRWTKNNGCNSLGEACKTGFENSAVIVIDNSPIFFGHFDTPAVGGVGPIDGGPLYFATAEQSFAHAANFSLRFTLDSDQDVLFLIGDDVPRDNRGGVSLSVDAVPEPATWAMMVAGFGLVGAGLRRRAAAGVSVSC